MKFHRARQGRAHSFRYRDPFDLNTSTTDPTYIGVVGIRDQPTSPSAGDGTNVTFQLLKVYVSGATTINRPITLPVNNAEFDVWENGVLQAETTDYTVNYATGIITFNTAPAAGLVIEWSGQFDVKCRFENDDMQASADDFDSGSVPSIPIIEVLDNEPAYMSEYFYGGSVVIQMSADRVADLGEAHTYVLDAQSAGLNFDLPVPTFIPQGGIHFTIIVIGSNSVQIRNHLSANLALIAVNRGCFAVYAQDSVSTSAWFLLGNQSAGEV